MTLGRVALVLISVVSMVLGGCEAADEKTQPPPVSPQWMPLALPTPPGEPGRLMLREAVACQSAWYILGAVGDASGETRPAAWTSRDGEKWTVVRLNPRSYYGERAILYAGACRGDQLAVVGAKVGGAHGNPRVTTWHQLPDGSLDEVLAEFELYGGPQAINVSRISAAPSGWMITGNRYSGAAVWLSSDSTDFDIKEGLPELSSDSRGGTWAVDIAATDEGWIVVGGLLGAGRIDRDPMAWKSTDGSVWHRTVAPATDEYEEFQGVAVFEGAVYSVGLRGDTFSVWRLTGDEWTQVAAFAAFVPGESAALRSITSRKRITVAVSNGAAYQLWTSTNAVSWQPVAFPGADVLPSGDKSVALLEMGQGMLLLVDDGKQSQAWVAKLP